MRDWHMDAPPWETEGMIPEAWFDRNHEKFILSMDEIMSRAVPFSEADPYEPVVYFLIKDDEIAYVGQSHCLNNRLCHHIRYGVKFDRVAYLDCIPGLFLPDVESFYIHAFLPPYNTKIEPLKGEILKTLKRLYPEATE